MSNIVLGCPLKTLFNTQMLVEGDSLCASLSKKNYSATAAQLDQPSRKGAVASLHRVAIKREDLTASKASFLVEEGGSYSCAYGPITSPAAQ